ncbi:MAG: phosphoribosylglycinamide synthetase C domain-containing protein [Clostridia bacterium]
MVDIVERYQSMEPWHRWISTGEDNAAVCMSCWRIRRAIPLHYAEDISIQGLHAFDGPGRIFHDLFTPGTAKNEEGQIVTNGGRVLGVVALDRDLNAAIAKALCQHQARLRFASMFIIGGISGENERGSCRKPS